VVCFGNHADFLQYAQYYFNFIRNDVQQEFQKKRSEKLPKLIIQLYDIACPHMANFMKTTLATMRREIKNRHPYSTELALSDLNLFGPMKVHLGGKKFQN
jgi:hypothetical protein